MCDALLKCVWRLTAAGQEESARGRTVREGPGRHAVMPAPDLVRGLALCHQHQLQMNGMAMTSMALSLPPPHEHDTIHNRPGRPHTGRAFPPQRSLCDLP